MITLGLLGLLSLHVTGSFTKFKRAGASQIITYAAADLARTLG